MSKTILILGTGLMQQPALKIARKWGWTVIGTDGNPHSDGAGLCDFFWPIDLKDTENLIRKASGFNGKHEINGVMTVGTDFSTSVAALTEALHLPGHSLYASRLAKDKSLMRSALSKAGVRIPEYIVVEPDRDIRSLENLSFPRVVKPVDNMGGRGIMTVRNFNELSIHVEEARKNSISGNVIIEQLIPGKEYSIDALVMDDEIRLYGIADRHIFFPPAFIEMGHTMPTDSSVGVQKDIVSEFKKGVKALNLTWGAAKGDIFYDGEKAYIGEIAARLSGGFMSGWTYPYSSGVSAIEDALRLAVGDSWKTPVREENYTSAERAGLSIPGICQSVIQNGKNEKEIQDIIFHKGIGDKLVFPRNNVQKVCNVISRSESRNKAILSAERKISQIKLRLKVPCKETFRFLSREEPAIPLAFELPAEHPLLQKSGIDPYTDPFTPTAELVAEKIVLPCLVSDIESEIKDWNHLSLKEVLYLLSKCYPLSFDETSVPGKTEKNFLLALIRGSWQGADWFCRYIGQEPLDQKD